MKKWHSIFNSFVCIKRISSLLTLTVLFFLFVYSQTAYSTIYDVSSDFSITTNPSGAWTYGWRNTLTGTNLNNYNAVGSNGDILYTWYNTSHVVSWAPSVVKNTSSNQTIIGKEAWLGNQVSFHPGSVGEYSVVRWTAPTDGIVSISASFDGIYMGGTTTDVHVLMNSTVLYDGSVNGYHLAILPSYSTVNPLTINKGDIIEFAVGYGNGSFVGDATALDAKINFNAVPIPGSFFLIAPSVFGIILFKRRYLG